MRNTIFDIIRGQGLRLSFCALALGLCSNIYAQEEVDDASGDGVEGLKAPKRTLQVDRNTTVQLRGVVIDDVTDFFAEFFLRFAILGTRNATFFHFFVNHASEVYLWIAFLGEMVNNDRLATTTHADNCEYFNIIHRLIVTQIRGVS